MKNIKKLLLLGVLGVGVFSVQATDGDEGRMKKIINRGAELSGEAVIGFANGVVTEILPPFSWVLIVPMVMGMSAPMKELDRSVLGLAYGAGILSTAAAQAYVLYHIVNDLGLIEK